MASQTCEIGDDIVAEFKKFKLSKSRKTNVIIFKINVKELVVETEEVLEGADWEQLVEDLPESVPRYMAVSYEWKMKDDRISYPLIFVYYSPEASAKLNMLYASTKSRLATALELSKEHDVHSREEMLELAKKLSIN